MKQKTIYIVLVIISMYLPASSNECGKITQAVIIENMEETAVQATAVSAEETDVLPVSPFSRLLFNL
ncbi:MAG: hypothetical protein ABIQ88_02150 [Chitinophagaceae bacterium]